MSLQLGLHRDAWKLNFDITRNWESALNKRNKNPGFVLAQVVLTLAWAQSRHSQALQSTQSDVMCPDEIHKSYSHGK